MFLLQKYMKNVYLRKYKKFFGVGFFRKKYKKYKYKKKV